MLSSPTEVQYVYFLSEKKNPTTYLLTLFDIHMHRIMITLHSTVNS